MTRSLDELRARAEEFAEAFENYEPAEGDDQKPLPPAIALQIAAYRRDQAEVELAETIRSVRAEGMSWREVGEKLGTSGEAARQRYANA